MKRNISLVLVSALTLFVLLVTSFGGARVDDYKYRVFCANNKIEVEQRTLEQQKNARGSNVCMLAEFSTLSDAEKYAEEHGGKGSDCKCS